MKHPPEDGKTIAGPSTEGLTLSVRGRGHWLLLSLASALYFFAHVRLAGDLRYPGHADPAYYFELAKSLAAGDGFDVPFTWHFLNYPEGLANRPNDYWMPLPSMLMAGTMRLLGASTFSAVLVPMVAAAAVPFAAYALSHEVLGDRRLALAVALASLTLPVLSDYAVVPDGTSLLALAGTITLALTVAARRRTAFLLFAGAGASAAISMLLRQDGALLTISIAAAIVTLRPLATAFRCGAAATVAFLFVSSPIAVMNWSNLGSPLPTAPRRMPWITHYEELYAFGSRLTPDRYLSLGPMALLEQRLDGLIEAGDLLSGGFGSPFFSVVVALWAAYGIRRSPWRTDLMVLIAFPLALLATHVLIFPVLLSGGGIAKSAPTGNIALLVAAAAGYRQMTNGSAKHMTRYVALVAVVLLLVPAVAAPINRVNAANRSGDRVVNIASGLTITDGSTVMTRDPWEFTSGTGIESVMIPFEDATGIKTVACRLNVQYIIEDETRDTSKLVEDGFAIRVRTSVLEVVGC